MPVPVAPVPRVLHALALAAACLTAAMSAHGQSAPPQAASRNAAPDTCATAPQLCPSLQAAQTTPPPNAPAAYPAIGLKLLYSLPAVSNGIATSKDGHAFVIFPRLEGTPGVRLAEVHPDSTLTPFPDASWNGIPTPANVATHFIRLNALRFGPEGHLWVIDTGARSFADPPAPGGARILVFNIETRKLIRSYALDTVITKKSYIDDIRFGAGPQQGLGYITDAGAPALIVLDLKTGAARRTLIDAVSTTDERPMIAQGKTMRKPSGEPVKVQADQLEVSPDGRFFYFEPSSGPLYRVETRYLADPKLSSAALEKHVTLFANTPATGGTAIDANGTIYMSDVNLGRILKITPQGTVTVLVSDPQKLVWGDAMWIDAHGNLLIPVPQLNHTAPMNGGHDTVQLPARIYSLPIHATAEAQGQAR